MNINETVTEPKRSNTDILKTEQAFYFEKEKTGKTRLPLLLQIVH